MVHIVVVVVHRSKYPFLPASLSLQTLDMKDDPQDNDDGSLPSLPHDFLIRVKNVNPLRDIMLQLLCLKYMI